MPRSLLGQLADAVHPGPQRAAHGIEQIGQRRIRRIIGQFAGPTPCSPDAAQLGKIVFHCRFQFIPARWHISESISLVYAPTGLPGQGLRLHQWIGGFHAEGVSDRFQGLELGGLFPVLQPHQRNPPDVRSTGQRQLCQPGRLPVPADPRADGLPTQRCYSLDGWPVGCVAIMPGEAPGNFDSSPVHSHHHRQVSRLCDYPTYDSGRPPDQGFVISYFARGDEGGGIRQFPCMGHIPR